MKKQRGDAGVAMMVMMVLMVGFWMTSGKDDGHRHMMGGHAGTPEDKQDRPSGIGKTPDRVPEKDHEEKIR